MKNFKQLLVDTIMFDKPKYLRQYLINSIVNNNIGTYHKNSGSIVSLCGKTMEEKIAECFYKKSKTIQLFDLMEIKKGYRYSILYKYTKNVSFDLDKIATNVMGEYYSKYVDDEDVDVDKQILYLQDEGHLYIKFHKIISVLDRKNLVKKYCRYPILLIFHKKVNLLEVRFDKLGLDNNYDFYKITMEPRIFEIKSAFNIQCEPFDTEKTIKYIVDNEKESVRQLIWSFETAKSKGLTLKSGIDGIMPFIGDLEIMIKDFKNRYSDDDGKVIECLDELSAYLDKTKKFANEKFRILKI
ncbi:hypothetical protein J2Z42_001257 [Clostridium algifaecis]|uniref:Uncharacterized protein n=1 Tax=Clostridium algifaecis TaxID=1472040 RepID=A0ABS4KSL2_9CLOT|nr:hypothetical protein [Clostridium algifaecis]MBP2032585.1 hypothetical protein [Clostridium algifaecis]